MPDGRDDVAAALDALGSEMDLDGRPWMASRTEFTQPTLAATLDARSSATRRAPRVDLIASAALSAHAGTDRIQHKAAWFNHSPAFAAAVGIITATARFEDRRRGRLAVEELKMALRDRLANVRCGDGQE